MGGCSDATRGIFMGGRESSGGIDVIQYVTMATVGNAQDFGNLTVAREASSGAASNGTRGVCGGGYAGGASNVLDYVVIQTTGNATDFGDLSVARYGTGACSGT